MTTVDAHSGTAASVPTVPMERLLYEVKKVIVGQDHLLERLAVALLAPKATRPPNVSGCPKAMAWLPHT